MLARLVPARRRVLSLGHSLRSRLPLMVLAFCASISSMHLPATERMVALKATLPAASPTFSLRSLLPSTEKEITSLPPRLASWSPLRSPRSESQSRPFIYTPVVPDDGRTRVHCSPALVRSLCSVSLPPMEILGYNHMAGVTCILKPVNGVNSSVPYPSGLEPWNAPIWNLENI